MTAVGWASTKAPARNVDSPLAPIVVKMKINDEGAERMQVIYDGNAVPDSFPMKEELDKIARNEDLVQRTETEKREAESDEDFAKRVEAGASREQRALRQANATIRELYRAQGQLEGVFVRARKAKLVDGRYAVSAWRASGPSTRGRAAQNGEEEDGEE